MTKGKKLFFLLLVSAIIPGVYILHGKYEKHTVYKGLSHNLVSYCMSQKYPLPLPSLILENARPFEKVPVNQNLQYAQLLEKCRRALQKYPQDKEIIKVSAEIMLLSQSTIDTAENYLNEIKNNSENWWNDFGVFLSAKHRYGEALWAFDKALDANHNNETVIINLAWICHRWGLHKRETEILKKLEKKPRFSFLIKMISKRKPEKGFSTPKMNQFLDVARTNHLKLKKLISASPGSACRFLINSVQKRLNQHGTPWDCFEKIASTTDTLLGSHFLEREVAYYRTLSGKNSKEYSLAIALFSKAKSFAKKGDIKNTIPFLLKSRFLFHKADARYMYQFCTYILGAEYYKIHSYVKALKYFNEILSIPESEVFPIFRAQAQGMKGTIYLYRGNYGGGMKLLEKTLYEQEKLKLNADIAITLNNMSFYYRELHDYFNRLIALSKMLTLSQEGYDLRTVSTALDNIATAYAALEQYGKAIKYLEKAAVLYRYLGKKRELFFVNYNLASIYIKEHRLTKASKYLELCSKIIEPSGENTNFFIGLIQLSRGRLNMLKGATGIARGYFLKASDAFRKLNYLNRLQNSLSLLAKCYSKEGHVDKAWYEYQEAFRVFNKRIENIDRKLQENLFMGNERELLKEIGVFCIEKKHSPWEGLYFLDIYSGWNFKNKLLNRSSTKKIPFPTKNYVNKLRNKLSLFPAGNILLKFFISNNKVYRIILSHTNEVNLECIGNVNEVTSLIRKLQDVIKNAPSQKGQKELDDSADKYKIYSSRLYNILFNKVGISTLYKKTLYLITDDILSSIPFTTLYVTEERKYLTQISKIEYLPSLRTFAGKKNKIAKNDSVLLGGLSKPNAPEYFYLAKLSGVTKEIGYLKTIFPSAKVLLDENFHMKKVLELLPTVQIAHFASHIIINNVNPFKSGLLLFKKDGSNNFILDSASISKLNLHRAKMVVLAGCKSGTGPLLSSEGINSLAGAFLGSGTRQIVVNTWDIPDKENAELMKYFYRRLIKSGNATDALRASQCYFIAQKQMSHPFFWGSMKIYTTCADR